MLARLRDIGVLTVVIHSNQPAPILLASANYAKTWDFDVLEREEPPREELFPTPPHSKPRLRSRKTTRADGSAGTPGTGGAGGPGNGTSTRDQEDKLASSSSGASASDAASSPPGSPVVVAGPGLLGRGHSEPLQDMIDKGYFALFFALRQGYSAVLARQQLKHALERGVGGRRDDGQALF